MKPIYEKLIACPDEGFAVKEIRGPACDCPWHFHAEYELILVLSSRGYRIVGDNITSLESGDMVFLGPNLPHAYQHEERMSARGPAAHCVLLQFEERFWSGLLQLPALSPVRRLLRRAALGLHVTGKTRTQVASMFLEMLGLKGARRVGAFLAVLDALARSRTCRPIVSPGFIAARNPFEQDRVNRVYQFIGEHYQRELKLTEVARLLHLSEGAFSRFFHAHLGKTFPAFVNDLRVGRACRLLAETEMNVTEIALACGYRNLSNFNRQFLRLKKTSPLDYRRQVQRGG